MFTSAGNPKRWTAHLQNHGITVVHVVSNVKFAKKCVEAGVDAIVAEGFEAGGHNGREEQSCGLIPIVRNSIDILNSSWWYRNRKRNVGGYGIRS